MPHSLFLGSGSVQWRLKKFDLDAGNDTTDTKEQHYRPSLAAINSNLKYSVAELAIQLFTFALFVNSAILIVAGSSLFNRPGADDADLIDIYNLLSTTIAPAAATVFALALLFSGLSAGIVCTVASQISTVGFMNYEMKPWMMRLITRTLAIIPAIAIAASSGRVGLGNALTASQVILSIFLPVISLPLVYYTGRARYMTVPAEQAGKTVDGDTVNPAGVNMANGWATSIASWILWIVVAVMNAALLVLIAIGDA